MSEHRFSITQGRAVQDVRITDAQFRTLSALGMYADKDGWCWPSQSSLAEDTGKSRKAVNEHIAALVGLGYIEKHKQFREDGGQMSNKYRLLFDLPEVTPLSTPEVTPLSTPEVTPPVTPRGYTNDPLNDPKNDKGVGSKPDLVDGILHFAEKEQAEKKATRQFENAFGFGSLPWHSGTKWDKFRKFVMQIHSTDPTAFGEYVIWRAGDGKYKAMSNKQIRTNPDVFIDTGWPEFLAENQSDGTHSKFEGV